MKRFLLVVLFTIAILIPVVANTYSIDKIGFSFEIPDSYSVKDQYIPSRHQYFAAHHPTAGALTFVVSSVPDYTNIQYDYISNEKILESVKALEKELKLYGATLYKTEVVTINGHKYLLLELSMSGFRHIQFQTIRDGNATSFTFTCSSLTTSIRKEIDLIMATVRTSDSQP